MLQHEQEQPLETSAAPAIPAAQIRVTSEELAQAINDLESSKDAAARHLAGTVPIGEVVQELKLEATPEEIWAQVQRQRARKAAEDAAVQPAFAPTATVQPAAPQVLPRPRRRWRGRWWALIGIGWAVYGVVHGSFVSPMTSRFAPVQSGTTVEVTGDGGTVSYVVHRSDVEVSGDNNTVTLRGQCSHLNVTGGGNTVRVIGTVKNVSTAGDHNKIHWTKERPGEAPVFENDGDGNQVGPSAP